MSHSTSATLSSRFSVTWVCALSSIDGERSTPVKRTVGLSEATWQSWVAGPQPRSTTSRQPWMTWLMRAV